MKLTAEQARVVDAFGDLYRGGRRRLSVGGYAGTGKSVVVAAIMRNYGGFAEAFGDAVEDVVVCAPTGKAAHVLRTKGIADACTFHSLVYTPIGTDHEGNPIFKRSGNPMPRVVIVDEASMLSAPMVRDLERVVKRVMYVGDHGQLAPIGDDPGLMRNPDIRLETVHRQASDSPIISFAHHVRQGHAPKTFGIDARVQDGWTQDLRDYDVVICGFNRTRMQVNAWMRKARGYEGPLPQIGERIICLRNSKDYETWNGMTATVREIDPHTERMSIDTDDGPRDNVAFDAEQFGMEQTKPYERPRKGRIAPTLWAFGYAVTCHKYQGSQADRVVVLDEVMDKWEPERWRYTAATRAAKQLRWVYK